MPESVPERVTVSASEVHEYFYCPYAWWCAAREVEPVRTKQMRRGLDYHDRMARTAAEPAKWGRLLLVVAGLLATVAVVLYFLGAR